MNKRDSVYLRYTFNDLAKNKGVNISLFVILILSAFLVVTGAMVIERMFGSVDELFEEAKPPHFLQMHKGEYDPAALEEFAAQRPEIDSWLIEEMIGFDGTAIAWQRPSTDESGDLSDSLIDNLFVTQNDDFDFLIDEDGAIPYPSPGEVYVPVAYQQGFGLQIGDELQVGTDSGVHALTITGFVRDSQMASSLASSTRFLVSEADFEELERTGGSSPEIIAEYRLTDDSMSTNFQDVYNSQEALPKNGPAITYPMVRLINALSDGLAAAALVFVGFLLIVISLLNARFVIRGTLQDEVREIGAMKAIGLPSKEIARLYLTKYSVMTFGACIVGGALAVIATNLLTQGIQVNYAKAQIGMSTILVPVLALASVYLLVIAICRRILRSVKKIQVVSALVHGSTLGDRQTARRVRRQAKRVRRSGLASYRGGNLNWRLALVDIRAESRQWIFVPIVFFLISVLITLPLNLLSTFESPRFMTFMLDFLKGDWHKSDSDFAIAAVAIPAGWALSGYIMALFLSGMRGVPDELREAARVDGATERQVFWHVVRPLLWPATMSATVILVHISMKTFDLLYAINPEDPRVETPALYMYRSMGGYLYARGATIATILVVAMAVIIVPYIWYTMRSERRS